MVSLKPYHLLLADDDAGFRETARGILEPYFVLFEAESGEEALELVEFERVDIALLDMHMKRLTGLETLRILKSHNELAPCILITADASDDLRRDAREADAYCVLSKPVRKIDLVTCVSSALVDVYDDPDAFSLTGSSP
ncbi:MAG TPA: response regulator [Planctomycetaceae bacterium]|nr:response regulator [Planctomycetaceae bacterium]